MRNFQIIAPVFMAATYTRVLAVDLDNKKSVTLLFRGESPSPNSSFSVSEKELLEYKILFATDDQKATGIRKLLLLNPNTTSLETQMKEKETVMSLLSKGKGEETQSLLEKLKLSAEKYKQDYFDRLAK